MQTSIAKYIQHHNLQPADVVVINRKGIPLLDHYAVYIGREEFVVNMRPNVQLIREWDIWKYIDRYQPIRIRRFEGSEYEREQAMQRAANLYYNQELKGEYNLLFDNCEHFANYVQYGQRYSQQTQIAGAGAMVAGGLMLTSKNENVQLFGALALLFGAGTLLFESLENNNNYQQTALNPVNYRKELK